MYVVFMVAFIRAGTMKTYQDQRSQENSKTHHKQFNFVTGVLSTVICFVYRLSGGIGPGMVAFIRPGTMEKHEM